MILKKPKVIKIEQPFLFVLTDDCNTDLVRDVAVALLKHIIQDNEIITYGDLASKMDHPINPRNLDYPLGCISEACKENGLPLLSVMVVNKDTLNPGAGFFKYFFPELKQNEWEPKFFELYNQVKEYNNWNCVLDAFM